ncbi:hypothetical protein crov214 [Cafeteria roenbergensis virus]|uniref:Uncharacterized protein n=1 Tax=Cafeteria roenbergensis virus (strain BV-PW1) TaxID=693272 RepID=E3T4Y4_CROVB|nr:hypothetical protein crov214 [Cafeteria roenbergensis virus BV-PW1]ADO67247.1 hypothetical protein crov214 [Cafeteria roenbergensis virus BV-PW1]
MALSIKKLHKLLLKKFSYNSSTGQLKIYHKNIFNYPKNNKSKGLKFEIHNNIKKDDIDNYVIEMLTSNSYKNCRVIHPYLIGLSWFNVKTFLKVKKCLSSDCNEVVPKTNLNQSLNYRHQTRETLKIICILLGNKLFEENFPEYYNFLLSDKGVTVEEKINVNLPDNLTKRWVDIKLSFDDKISIYLEINEKHHDKEKDMKRAIEIFTKTNTMPLLYYQDEEDMTNLIPRIYLEICYAIANVDIHQALKFYLIIIDKLDPTFVNFSIDNINYKKIPVNQICLTLKQAGMTLASKYIKTLIIDGLLQEDDIEYEGTNVLEGTVSQTGCDIIFMRLDNKFFKGLESHNLATHLCKQYALIKQKYFKTLKTMLAHQQNHFKIIFKNRNELEHMFQEIKPVNQIIMEMNEMLYINCNITLLQKIKEEFDIELHPKYLFLVREEGKYLNNRTFKKITKAKYHETEETSNNIVNYRWIKQEEWDTIKTLF